MVIGIEHDVAAADCLFDDASPREIEGAAFAGVALIRRTIVDMQATYARLQARGADHDRITNLDRAGEHCPCDDYPRSGKREAAIDSQPETASGRSAHHFIGSSEKALP